MQSPASGRPRARRRALAGLVALLLLALLPPANARERRHHKPNPVRVVLQPFLVARSVVHTVADPIAANAPRALAVLATAPIRVARRGHEVLRGELVQDQEEDAPVRLAYLVPGPQHPNPPNPEQTDEEDQDVAPDLEPEPEPEPEKFGKGPTVPGSRAALRSGIAYAPSRAPQSVKNAIWAANTLRRKPYIWGGGHGSFHDRGYDCSGTVSFALHGAGAIGAPLPSSDFMRFGKRGRGRWFTIYARPGHTFAVIAGLRLDTTDFQNSGNTGPRWHAEMRDTRGYVARHPVGM